MINNAEHNEIFKWKALKGFRDVWFSGEYDSLPFAKRFNLAMKHSSVLINNSMISPTNGVVKLAEEYPEQVERLFNETLFSGETDIKSVQDKMERFIEETENMRQTKFPGYYKYKQERHSVSCYLFFFNPSLHFIYRYREAEEFAKYIEFGKDLGSGENFNLLHYYELANIVVDALKEHPSLLKKYDKLIKESAEHYYDESLHLLAFDLMYCSRCYNFYSGLTHIEKKASIKEYTLQQLREEQAREQAEKIRAIEDEIHGLSVQMEQYESISLVNVEVTQKTYGVGKVTEQDYNTIKVKFADVEKTFVISKRFSMRPTFENDSEIVEAYTQFEALNERKKNLTRQLQTLEKSFNKTL